MNKIFFHTADKKANIKNGNAVKAVLRRLFELENTVLERLDYIFCSDEYLLRINQQHLKHNTLTDIITFLLTSKKEPVTGEIYISIDRIRENAKTHKVSYQNEILRIMIHGALHLCGYKDNSKILKTKMSVKEDYYLDLYKVSRESHT